MVALILADGDAPARTRLDRSWPGWADDIDLVVAADGGARYAAGLGFAIDRWVGDGDSIAEADLAGLAATGVAIQRWPVDKDASDTELALDLAFDSGAEAAIVVGALGGARLDHALANILSLARPGRRGRITIIDEMTRLSAIGPDDDGHPGQSSLHGRPGDIVSLLPLGGDCDGITTVGLRYPLADEPLSLGSSRGSSNVIEGSDARVTVRQGTLLIVESPARL
jgi:thiamine pyrophosphokinase